MKTQNKYEGFFLEPYTALKEVVLTVIQNNDQILDIGCNNGNLVALIDETIQNAYVYCVDNDQTALNELLTRKISNTKFQVFLSDATDFLQACSLQDLDLIVINATLHEINTPENQPKYLDFLFTKLKQLLRPGGKLVIGDYFYPETVTNEEIAEYREWQMQAIGHSDPREKFVPPPLIKQKAIEHGFSLKHSEELSAAKSIDRKYNIFVFENPSL